VRESISGRCGRDRRSRPGLEAAAARVDELISRLDLGGAQAGADAPVDRLSGGWRKRVALARELVREPELLLLDEPTNHLDVDSILWLEKLLASAPFATVTITHDRLFLQRVANRILELDRRNPGGLLSVDGDYATFIERKADLMAAQERRETSLRNTTLRRETEWLRAGAPARSTKQQARIQRAEVLAGEVDELAGRNLVRSADIDFIGTGRNPRRLIEARGIAKSYGDKIIFAGLDLFVGPGSRVGLIGPNGCGKSTLLRVLVGDEPPDTGQILRADGLQVAYFAQHREALDPNLSVVDTLCPGGDHVTFRGARIHVSGYLARFLFRSEHAKLTVGQLSGGEQSRLALARLMLRPANVLVLDEPTNDLDLDTLQVLEDSLLGFDGAILLVTHDRYFLDRVTTKLLAFHTRPSARGAHRVHGGPQSMGDLVRRGGRGLCRREHRCQAQDSRTNQRPAPQAQLPRPARMGHHRSSHRRGRSTPDRAAGRARQPRGRQQPQPPGRARGRDRHRQG
jgi:ATP-binding cassette subfamily F protein uup